MYVNPKIVSGEMDQQSMQLYWAPLREEDKFELILLGLALSSFST